jgi:hypothetical protein
MSAALLLILGLFFIWLVASKRAAAVAKAIMTPA